MPDFIGLLAMSIVLAVSSFGIGSLPLFFTFSRKGISEPCHCCPNTRGNVRFNVRQIGYIWHGFTSGYGVGNHYT